MEKRHMQDQYILALDQGTTSSRAMLFDRHGSVVSMAQKEWEEFCWIRREFISRIRSWTDG